MNKQQQNDQQIRQTLLELSQELEHTTALDENQRVAIRHLMADIQELLNRSDEGVSPRYQPSQPFLARLRKAVTLFEVSHPTLTSLVENTLDILVFAGI